MGEARDAACPPLPLSTGAFQTPVIPRAPLVPGAIVMFCPVSSVSYDTEGRGHITYQEFLQKLGVAYSPAIHRPFAEDYFNFMGHFTKPQQVQEEMRELQQTREAEKPRAAR